MDLKILITESQYEHIHKSLILEGAFWTKEKFLEALKTNPKIRRNEHGNLLFNYDNIEVGDVYPYYIKNIICPKHGPLGGDKGVDIYSHLRGNGCRKCSDENSGKLKRKDKEDFIIKTREKFGDYFNLDNIEYVHIMKDKKSRSFVKNIICPKHGVIGGGISDGEKGINPYTFLKSEKGCPKCSDESTGEKNSMSKEEFIRLAKQIHGDKYDYDNIELIRVKIERPTSDKAKYDTFVKNIMCHKKDFNGIEHGPIGGEKGQRGYSHLAGDGCKKCASEKLSLDRSDDTQRFIEKAEKKHGVGRYDYSLVNYNRSWIHVPIICHQKYNNGKEHGVWLIKPSNHLQGGGCPICSESKGEIDLKNILISKRIKFERQKKFPGVVSKYMQRGGKIYKINRSLHFDLYLPNKNVLIEFDGEFHFNIIFKREEFINQVKNDRLKNEWVKNQPKLRLIRIASNDKDNLVEELMNGLQSNEKIYLSKNYPKNLGWRSDKKYIKGKFK